MARVALITFSDGRDFVYRDLEQFTSGVEDRDRDVARGPRTRGRARSRDGHQQRDRCARSTPDRGRPARSDDLQHPGLVVPALHDARRRETPGALRCSPRSTPSTRAWSACSPAAVRSTRSGAGTAASGATSPTRRWRAALDVADPRRGRRCGAARLHVRPHRRPADGHVHGRGQHRPVAASSSASTSRRSTSGSSCGDPRRSTRAGSAMRARVARAARRRRALRRRPADARSSSNARSAPTTRCAS